MTITQKRIDYDPKNPLFQKFPNLTNLSDDEILLGLLFDTLWQRTGESGKLNLTGFISYYDPEFTDRCVLYMMVRYPYTTVDSLCIVLDSTRITSDKLPEIIF